MINYEVKMTEIFDDEEKAIPEDDELAELEVQDALEDLRVNQGSDARRRLEDLMDEKKLKVELDDYFELDDL